MARSLLRRARRWLHSKILILRSFLSCGMRYSQTLMHFWAVNILPRHIAASEFALITFDLQVSMREHCLSKKAEQSALSWSNFLLFSSIMLFSMSLALAIPVVGVYF